MVVDFHAHHNFLNCVFELSFVHHSNIFKEKYSLNSFEINVRLLRKATPFSPHHYFGLHFLFVPPINFKRIRNNKWINLEVTRTSANTIQ